MEWVRTLLKCNWASFNYTDVGAPPWKISQQRNVRFFEQPPPSMIIWLLCTLRLLRCDYEKIRGIVFGKYLFVSCEVLLMIMLLLLYELKALITFMNLLFINARASSSSLINTNWVVAVGYGYMKMILGYMGNSHWLGWGSLVASPLGYVTTNWVNAGQFAVGRSWVSSRRGDRHSNTNIQGTIMHTF